VRLLLLGVGGPDVENFFQVAEEGHGALFSRPVAQYFL
jgi:hypothetical protein